MAKHGLLSKTLKRNSPTILTVNRPHVAQLNIIMHDIHGKHSALTAALKALDRQQQDAHDTRVVQTDEYRRFHKTPDANRYAPYPSHPTESHLIQTSHKTAALAATINIPFVADPIHVVHTDWKPILPPYPVFHLQDTPSAICCKYSLLHKMNISAIRLLRRIKRRLIRTIGRQKTCQINHDININQLHNACQNANPQRLSAPTLCLSTTIPQPPGHDPIKTTATTTPQQIQATIDTYGRQMAPPPGKPLFFGTLSHDAAGPAGVTIHPKRQFTETHLLEYHPQQSLFYKYTK